MQHGVVPTGAQRQGDVVRLGLGSGGAKGWRWGGQSGYAGRDGRLKGQSVQH